MAQLERENYLGTVAFTRQRRVLQMRLISSTVITHLTSLSPSTSPTMPDKYVGPLYFKTPVKVDLFDIYNDGTKLQTNYIYDESQSIRINSFTKFMVQMLSYRR